MNLKNITIDVNYKGLSEIEKSQLILANQLIENFNSILKPHQSPNHFKYKSGQFEANYGYAFRALQDDINHAKELDEQMHFNYIKDLLTKKTSELQTFKQIKISNTYSIEEFLKTFISYYNYNIDHEIPSYISKANFKKLINQISEDVNILSKK